MWINKFQNLTKFQKLLVFILPIIFFSIIFLAVFQTSINSAKVEVAIAPKKSEIFINGKKYSNNSTFFITPGEKEIIVKADGFNELKTNINFSNQKTTFLYRSLEPNENNKDYYEKNSEENELRDYIAQSLFTLELEQYNNDPIFKVTPVTNYKLGFSASASRDENDFNKITLTIDLITCYDERVDKLKKNAESYFKQKGINLSKYQVKYTHCEDSGKPHERVIKTPY